MYLTPRENDLIHDWTPKGVPGVLGGAPIMINDETLRDGLQNASVTDPPIEAKKRLLHLMDRLGIETACVGLPGAGPRQQEHAEQLCREIAASRLNIRPNCAGRTLKVDIVPMLELSQRAGVAVEVCVFVGSSPIRRYAEGWDLDVILQRTREAVGFAVREGTDVMFVTEDTVRTAPNDLRLILTLAVETGAKRICLCDTVGGATPEGVTNLVSWTRRLLDDMGANVGIDWHGHRDRGLALANTLAAVKAGATRVHGTALGVGERAGNTPIEEILVNLKLEGLREDDLSSLPEYSGVASDALKIAIPASAPIVGRDAFRTATGVHASALLKARDKCDGWLADRVYSGVPASWLGRQQEVEIGPLSGAANVVYYLTSREYPAGEDNVRAVLAAAKLSRTLLTESEIQRLVAG